MTLPPPGTVLKALADVPDPGGAPADWTGTPILVVRSGGTVRAYRNLCPHANRPLCLPSGKVLVSEGRYVVCPFHGASFDIATGACAGGPAGRSVLTRVPVEVRGGAVVAL